MQPLTHHEILPLVAPFARRGRHVDLPASNRLERRLAFKPIDHPAAPAAPAVPHGLPALREDLLLENDEPGTFRLTRVLTLAGGLEARLQAEGAEPGELLARIEAVPPQRQWVLGPGYTLALCHRLQAGTTLELTAATSAVGDLRMTLEAPAVKGSPARLEITPGSGGPLRLPDDLLSVLGWDWSRLREAHAGWSAGLQVRGREPERSRSAEAKFERTASHLAATLADSPGAFHDRWVLARWRVYLRRATPLLTCILLIAAAAAVPRLHLTETSAARMLIFNSPPLLMMLFFTMREVPIIEIPPLPWRSTAAGWRS